MFKLIARIAYTALVIIEAGIIFRLAVLIFNLNQSNTYILWLMHVTNILVAPFKGVLSSEYLLIGNWSIELVSIVALFFYVILAFITVEIIKAFSTD